MCGITTARIIDESVNRLPNSGESYTFHGRDIYAYTGARFAGLWTNIPREMFKTLGLQYGSRVEISIANETRTLYKNIVLFAKSFADVYAGEPLLYVNSLDNIAMAIN
ncbi:MAG: SAM hydroxide adenosyltransferase [Ruthenibacterium sp.]